MSARLKIPSYIKPKNVDPNQLWNKLETAIELIYNQNASPLSYQDLFGYAYDMIQNKHGNFLYDSLEISLKKNVKILCSELQNQRDEIFLRNLIDLWKIHLASINVIADILMYMDRTFVRSNNKMNVINLGNQIFLKEILTSNILKRIKNLLLNIIDRDRKNEEIANGFLLRDIIEMFLSFQSKTIYEQYFEIDFLKTSEEYFKIQAEKYLENLTITEYIKKVSHLMKSESDRYLNTTIQKKINDSIVANMVVSCINTILEKQNSGIRSLLNNWRFEDLKFLYYFLRISPETLIKFSQVVTSTLTSKGSQILQDEVNNLKPIEQIELILDLKNKTEELLKTFSYIRPGTNILQKDPLFLKACKESWVNISNMNNRYSEFVSLYIDNKLRKFELDESDLESMINDIIYIIRQLKDKDIFENIYIAHLSRRLLQKTSISLDTERFIISKFKIEFGTFFTSKMEGMIKDIQTFPEFDSKFKTHLNQRNIHSPIDLSVKVLKTGGWPFYIANDIQLSNTIQQSKSIFEEWYFETQNGKKLKWIYHLGDAYILMNGFTSQYEIKVSSIQMIILLLFNENDSLSINQISDILKIPIDRLKRILFSLSSNTQIHKRILNKSDEKISDLTIFSPNNEFKSKKIKIKLCPLIAKQDSLSLLENNNRLNEERKWLLDATIVRIMKERKIISHKDLILEVTIQLSERFMPNSEIIKKQIESLIEREYIERVYEEGSLYSQFYKYVA